MYRLIPLASVMVALGIVVYLYLDQPKQNTVPTKTTTVAPASPKVSEKKKHEGKLDSKTISSTVQITEEQTLTPEERRKTFVTLAHNTERYTGKALILEKDLIYLEEQIVNQKIIDKFSQELMRYEQFDPSDPHMSLKMLNTFSNILQRKELEEYHDQVINALETIVLSDTIKPNFSSAQKKAMVADRIMILQTLKEYKDLDLEVLAYQSQDKNLKSLIEFIGKN